MSAIKHFTVLTPISALRLDQKIIVVGSSDLATNLAARLDAQLVPAIIDADTLENFRGAMDGEPELIKAVFIDSWTSPMDFSSTPEEVIINMIDAAEIVLNRCRGHNHANAHCELVHFHPFATPSNYVARGLPADLDPSKNQTSWFNELSTRITDLADSTTNSSAMSLSNAVRHPRLKDRHFWTNWAEYAIDDDQSRKNCSTLTAEAKDMLENGCIKCPAGPTKKRCC